MSEPRPRATLGNASAIAGDLAEWPPPEAHKAPTGKSGVGDGRRFAYYPLKRGFRQGRVPMPVGRRGSVGSVDRDLIL